MWSIKRAALALMAATALSSGGAVTLGVGTAHAGALGCGPVTAPYSDWAANCETQLENDAAPYVQTALDLYRATFVIAGQVLQDAYNACGGSPHDCLETGLAKLAAEMQRVCGGDGSSWLPLSDCEQTTVNVADGLMLIFCSAGQTTSDCENSIVNTAIASAGALTDLAGSAGGSGGCHSGVFNEIYCDVTFQLQDYKPGTYMWSDPGCPPGAPYGCTATDTYHSSVNSTWHVVGGGFFAQYTTTVTHSHAESDYLQGTAFVSSSPCCSVDRIEATENWHVDSVSVSANAGPQSGGGSFSANNGDVWWNGVVHTQGFLPHDAVGIEFDTTGWFNAKHSNYMTAYQAVPPEPYQSAQSAYALGKAH